MTGAKLCQVEGGYTLVTIPHHFSELTWKANISSQKNGGKKSPHIRPSSRGETRKRWVTNLKRVSVLQKSQTRRETEKASSCTFLEIAMGQEKNQKRRPAQSHRTARF